MQASRYHGPTCTKPHLQYDSIHVPAKGKIPAINDGEFGCSCSHCSKVNKETAYLTAVQKPTRNRTAVKVGDHVSVSGEPGIVYYVGDLDSDYTNDKIFVGVQLHNPVGKHDGVINGKRYFKCRPNRGVLLPLDEVQLLPNPKKSYSGLKFMQRLSAPKKHNKTDTSKLHAQAKHTSTLSLLNNRGSSASVDSIPKPASILKKAGLKNEHAKRVSFSDIVEFFPASLNGSESQFIVLKNKLAQHVLKPRPVSGAPVKKISELRCLESKLSLPQRPPTPPPTPDTKSLPRAFGHKPASIGPQLQERKSPSAKYTGENLRNPLEEQWGKFAHIVEQLKANRATSNKLYLSPEKCPGQAFPAQNKDPDYNRNLGQWGVFKMEAVIEKEQQQRERQRLRFNLQERLLQDQIDELTLRFESVLKFLKDIPETAHVADLLNEEAGME